MGTFTAHIELEECEIIDYIRSNFHPHEVYDMDELEDWAEANGYVKEVNTGD